ncbi:P fimbrial usher protein PapC, partial [Escherichia coli]|nr:P fimbrial usher protein PapC [Salmonella enterica subsp. enterica serovar Uganda]EFF9644031.1 P fimbrial usher protein PapC [Escherichia coli]
MKDRIPFAVNNITCVILLSLFCNAASAVEFNTDVLDAADKKNIDFTRFSEAGYVLPGQYLLDVIVNGQSISPASLQISFVEPALSGDKAEKKLPQACLTSDMVRLMGLTAESLDKVVYWHDGQCADFHGLPGVDIRPDTGAGVLRINMPQAWLEYSDATWLPPSRWDDGIPGLMLDYNLNGTVSRNYQGGDSHQFSYNGTVGGNLGPWRLRADYQGSQEQSRYNGEKTTNRNFTWSRFYLFRAIPRWRANLTLGENNINSDIFRSWSYTGASLESDDRMLPPRLRGYAPQITGIAETNARVVVSQQGRVLYDSMVPAGPFSIQDLDSSVRGRLDVEVIEQNGRKKTFQVDTASVPYLTRPGQVRYKLVSGRSRGYGHETEGPVFATGEASWGLSNQWSLYGGAVLAGDYNALAAGAGWDLGVPGTLSADITQSVARIEGERTFQGKSWRLSYSKRFDNADADITFAGYRFSERNYMTMEQYLNARYRNDYSSREKEMYTVTLNKNVAD